MKCEHDLECINPVDVSTATSSGLLTSIAISEAIRPYFKCKKCKKVFTQRRFGDGHFTADLYLVKLEEGKIPDYCYD